MGWAVSFVVGAVTAAVAHFVFGASLLTTVSWAIFMASLASLFFYKPQIQTTKPRPFSLSDIEITQANQGIPIPLIYGTVKITPNILWYGNLKTVPRKEKIETSGFFGLFKKKKKVTVGYDYYIDIVYGLAYTPKGADLLWGYRNEKRFKIKEEDSQGKVPSSKYYADYVFEDGLDNSPPPINLEFMNRMEGLSFLYLKQYYIGFNTKIIPNTSFVLNYTPDVGLPYYRIEVNPDVGDYTYNPASFAWDILKNYVGMDNLDYGSFSSASEYFYNKGYGINVVISSIQDIIPFLQQILNTLGAKLCYKSDGKIHLEIESKQDTTSVKTITNIQNLSVTKQTWIDVPNDFKFNYVGDNFEVKTIEIVNTIACKKAGTRIMETIDLTFIRGDEKATKLANEVATRLSLQRLACRFTTDLDSAKDLSVGDIITVEDAKSGLTFNMIVKTIRFHRFVENLVDIEGISYDEGLIAYIDTNNLGSATYDYLVEPPPAPVDITIKQMPNMYWLVKEEDMNMYLLCLVIKENQNCTHVVVYGDYEVDEPSFPGEFLGEVGYSYEAILLEDVSFKYTVDLEQKIKIKLVSQDGYIPTLPFENLTEEEWLNMKNLLYINGEIIAFRYISQISSDTFELSWLIRGISWTSKSDHSSGSKVILIGDSSIIPLEKNSDIYLRFADAYKLFNPPYDLEEEDFTDLVYTTNYTSITPQPVCAIKAVRNGSSVEIEWFPVSYFSLYGAGMSYPNEYETSLPRDYRVDFKYSTDGTNWTSTDDYKVTIDNANSFTFYVKQVYQGRESDVVSIEVGTEDGTYWVNP